MNDEQNIAVIGLDDFNLEMLRTVRDAERYNFSGLIDYEQIVNPDKYPIEDFIHSAQNDMDNVPGGLNAIVGHWDFPTTSLLPILRDQAGHNTPSLKAALTCENKYGTRLATSEVAPELTPPFALVDPNDDALLDDPPLDYPFWLKPVVAFSSTLGFRVDNREDLRHALKQIRQGIGKFAAPFDTFMQRALLGDQRALLQGNYCVAEGIISGSGCTVEGYVLNGEAYVYGVIDSLRAEGGSSFVGYTYPSNLPQTVLDHMTEKSKQLATHIGLDNTPFNIEFLWDEEHDDLKLLEVNARISKSHSPLFFLVEGASHHEVAIDVAMNKTPNFPNGGGPYKYAAKFMPRSYDTARVTRVPTEADVERLRERFPHAMFKSHVTEGMQLEDLPNQDSYSYELADLFLGADAYEELASDFREAMKILGFRFSRKVRTNYE
ncbi:ATP-grasp domain-containing protein [Salinisphaera sp. SPP-AMP-43]|uniref:ATP-grasp domain-containing protein n=1 Tax=Salinisphaera sp. SPP-AMP-43 TaxID=3121288 RepID=UPI003C6DCC64